MTRAWQKNPKISKLLGLALVASVLISWSLSSGKELDQLPARARIVDVRTPGEFKSTHFPGAENIPLGEIEGRLEEFGPRDSEIVVYCRSGRRSGMAKKILEKAGYTHVINGGGLSDMMKLKAKQTGGH